MIGFPDFLRMLLGWPSAAQPAARGPFIWDELDSFEPGMEAGSDSMPGIEAASAAVPGLVAECDYFPGVVEADDFCPGFMDGQSGTGA